MNERLKRVLAIVGLCFMAIFSVFFVMYLIKPDMLGGAVGVVAGAAFVVGVSIFLWIYFMRGFPSQIRKAEEMEELRIAAEKKMAENEENATLAAKSEQNEQLVSDAAGEKSEEIAADSSAEKPDSPAENG